LEVRNRWKSAEQMAGKEAESKSKSTNEPKLELIHAIPKRKQLALNNVTMMEQR
jgi:hypothetical protein